MGQLTRAVCAAITVLSVTSAVSAQTWQSRVLDTGALVYGEAFAPERTLSFGCTVPSRQGRPLIETGDHEAQRTDTPFTMILRFSEALVSPFEDSRPLAQPRITLDGVTYTLPQMVWDEFFSNWNVTLSMTDGLVAALPEAGDLVVDPGRGTAYRYPVDGLAAALDTAMAACASGWASLGQPVPGALADLGAGAGNGAAPAIDPVALVDRYIRTECNGGYTSGPNALAEADLDRDGVGDLVLDWADITCQGPLARPFCGAANCSIDVFLSTRPGAPPAGFLGVGYEFATAPNGALGLRVFGTAAACAGGACDRPFWWTGTEFTR